MAIMNALQPEAPKFPQHHASHFGMYSAKSVPGTTHVHELFSSL